MTLHVVKPATLINDIHHDGMRTMNLIILMNVWGEVHAVICVLLLLHESDMHSVY